MANVTISGLTAATSLNDADVLEVEQGGSPKKVAASVIADYLAGGGLSDGVKLGGTAAANLLDDYEEGTWTPVLTSSTGVFAYTTNLGSYTKIGNMVYCRIFISMSSVSGSGGINISLPLPSSSSDTNNGNAGILIDNLTSDLRQLGLQPNKSASTAVITKNIGQATAHGVLGANELSSSTKIRTQFMYESA